MSFLVDTNVFSAVMGEPLDARVDHWLKENQTEIYTSSITIAELAYGIERLAPGQKRRRLEVGLSDLIQSMGDRILRFDTRAARIWGKLQAELERAAHKMPVEDSYITAIALRHNLAVATRNVADFKRAGVATINPFQAG